MAGGESDKTDLACRSRDGAADGRRSAAPAAFARANTTGQDHAPLTATRDFRIDIVST